MNDYLAFSLTRTIYQGPLKSVCTPGLNCYSCPSATLSCPIGSLQNVLNVLRSSIETGTYHFGFYVIGFLGVIGTGVGRMACGWACPFVLLQDLIYKIPSPKFSIPRFLRPLKYLVLLVTVILLPGLLLDEFGFGEPTFCKYICPAGTLEAGIPLILLRPEYKAQIGPLFYMKLSILLVFLVLMVMVRRPFCGTTCPLGAFYSIFNKSSILRLKVSSEKCVKCNACFKGCPMGIKVYENPNQGDCIRCMKCKNQSCKYGVIDYELAGFEGNSRSGKG